MTRDLEDSLLERLHEASQRGMLRWQTDCDDANRDVWTADMGGEPLRVELIYVQRATGGSFERLAIEVLAFGHLLTAGVGSARYCQVMDMLSYSMDGWREASQVSEKTLKKAVAKLDSLLKSA